MKKHDAQRLVRWFVVGLLSTAALRGHGATNRVGAGWAYSTISAAVAATVDGDVVLVDTGTYSVATGEVFPITITNRVSIRAAVASGRPRISGDGTNSVVLIACSGVVLDGLRISGGLASEGIHGMDGGGICISVGADTTGRVTIANCEVTGNSCPYDETYDGSGGGIYCGGTWCTCFNTLITNCVVSDNYVRGNGGGIYCGILSQVHIVATEIAGNTAHDRGGGIHVADFGTLTIDAGCRIADNAAPGDNERTGWGGKGGGIYYAGWADGNIAHAEITNNAARYYGGGIFTLSAQDNHISDSVLSGNRAGNGVFPTVSCGGGAYLRDGARLSFSNCVFYRNDAELNGGGVCLAGGAQGASAEFVGNTDNLFEGNEAVGDGGALYLGAGSWVEVNGTRFLGNSSGLDGGALWLGSGSMATLTNALLTYNGSARGRGAGLYAGDGAVAVVDHGTLVGNFACFDRSALFAAASAALRVSGSILWSNAGGSVSSNGLFMVNSLVEDTDITGSGVLHGNPGFVGWGGQTNIHVDSASPGPGNGSAASPYRDLQLALDAFDFRLATNAPVIGLGAPTGVGGSVGAPIASLVIAGGTYDVRGRGFMQTAGIQGAGAGITILSNTVFGLARDAHVDGLDVAGEDWFGGTVTRANLHFSDVCVRDCTVRGSGGGLFVANGALTFTNCEVAINTATDDGGGLRIEPGATASFADSTVSSNTCGNRGGGLYIGGAVTARETTVACNAGPAEGGGFFVAGTFDLQACTVTSNNAAEIPWPTGMDWWRKAGGGGYVTTNAMLTASDQTVFKGNSARGRAGGLYCGGTVFLNDCVFEENSAWEQAGAIYTPSPPEPPDHYGVASPVCDTCRFVGNTVNWSGGAYFCDWRGRSSFTNCDFEANRTLWGGGGGAVESLGDAIPFFADCRFTANASRDMGGAFYSYGSEASFVYCRFYGNSATKRGGTFFAGNDSYWVDGCRFLDCEFVDSRCALAGGAVFLDRGQPLFSNCQFRDCRAGEQGGAVAARNDSRPWFEYSVFSNNNATLGGALYGADHSALIMEACNVLRNRADSPSISGDGGAIGLTDDAAAVMRWCTFEANHATDDGGAVSLAGNAWLDAGNSLFVSNLAENAGGAIHFTSRATGTVHNCTMAANRAVSGGGGGMYLDQSSSAAARSLIATANTPDDIDDAGRVTVSYSCIQSSRSGTGNIVTNPALDVAWVPAAGSPCIDAGPADMSLNDGALPPGQGSTRNDMGFTGGPINSGLHTGYGDTARWGSFEFTHTGVVSNTSDGVRLLSIAGNPLDGASQQGWAWSTRPLPIASGFDVSFGFRVNSTTYGADGFAFVVQNQQPRMTGWGGVDMSYGGIRNSLAVEFDTNLNGGEPNGNHVSVNSRGQEQNSWYHPNASLGVSTAIANMSDGGRHWARIRYIPGLLQVFMDGQTTPSVAVATNLSDLLYMPDGYAWIGLTAATYNHPDYAEEYEIGQFTAIEPLGMLTDTDGDGLFDWWEWRFFRSITAAVASADDDGDGMSNIEEQACDTDPRDSASVLMFTAVERIPDSLPARSARTRLSWTGGYAARQVLQCTTNLTAAPVVWTTIRTNEPPTLCKDTYSCPREANAMTFYRLHVVAPR